MNILTFDIEEWYLEKMYFGDHAEKYKEFDRYLGKILDMLDERNLKGTFFCVGGLGREFPDVVRRIAERGHEVGGHSDVHTWLNKMTPEECLADTRRAVDSLEQVIGSKVRSYRAPAFSIGAGNKWAFEVLAECGIERDASVFPAVRDFGGFAEFGQKTPAIIRYNGIELKEFPICTAKLLGKEVAYSGGGYFRFFPLWYVKKEMASADYSMTYFHIGDFLQKEIMRKEDFEEYFKMKGSFLSRCVRHMKRNVGVAGAYAKFHEFMECESFRSIEEAVADIDWSKQPVVDL